MTTFLSSARANAAVKRLKVYAQPLRLMILSILKDGEQTVSRIEKLSGIRQPALSQQLAELRHAGLVVTRRAVRQVYYCLADAEVASCVLAVESIFGACHDKSSSRPSLPPPVPSPSTRHPLSAASFARIL
jgi:DNA-binding transcriptional ArsR family regulator